MDIDLLAKEIKNRVEFLETRYDVYMWKLDDEELYNFLNIIYSEFFNQKSLALFFTCMIEYFDYLFDDAMSDNHILINKEYLASHLYYLQIVFTKNEVNDNAYVIIEKLNIANKKKLLTKNM